MEVKVYSSIAEVDEAKWNVIVEKNRLICTHKYIEAVEKSNINDCRFFYPVVYDEGEIIAHATCYYISTELDAFAQGVVKNMVSLIRRRWKGFFILRTLECGTPVAAGNTISFRKDVDRVAILDLLCREIERLAGEDIQVDAVLALAEVRGDRARLDQLHQAVARRDRRLVSEVFDKRLAVPLHPDATAQLAHERVNLLAAPNACGVAVVEIQNQLRPELLVRSAHFTNSFA